LAELARQRHGRRRQRAAVGRHKVHQAKAQRGDARVGGDLKSAVHRGGRFDQHMQRQLRRTCGVHRSDRALHIGERLDLWHHEVAQAVAGHTHDVGHIGLKRGVIHRVHPHSHPSAGRSAQGQFGHQRSVLGFTADGRAVFAVEGDIKDAGAEFGAHVGLQLQAFVHARHHAAVVIAHRQGPSRGLGVQQHITRVKSRSSHDFDARGNFFISLQARTNEGGAGSRKGALRHIRSNAFTWCSVTSLALSLYL
jgi:hypothetical protein